MNAMVRQIAVLSVLWAMCEMLLPDGRHQQMVRMTASLLVMTALVTTAGSWISGGETALPAITQTVQSVSESAYRRTALTALANQLESWCVHTAQRAGYEAAAAVYLTMDGAVERIDLALKATAPLMEASELAARMAQQLGLAAERLRFSVEGV